MIKEIIKFIGYILIKWLLFYIYQFIERGNFHGWGQSTNFEGKILTLIMLLGLPFIEIVIFFFLF